MSTEAQNELFLIEAFDLIGNTTVLGAFYGVAFALYCLCTRSLYLELQDPDKRRRARFTIGYISFVFLCATGYFIVASRARQLAYVNYANLPGGPLGYVASFNATLNPYQAAASVFDVIVEFSTLAIQIWRLWIIWRGTRYAIAVTILPVLLLLCYFAMAILVEIIHGFIPLDQLGIAPNVTSVMNTAGYAILSAVTITVTALIIGHLLFIQRRHIKLMGTSNTSNTPYVGIIAMLVESYALESAWSLAAAIALGVNSPSLYLFVLNDSTVKVITYFLLLYRVSTGRRPTGEAERKLTSLRWNPDSQGSRSFTVTANEAGEIHSPFPVTTTGVGKVSSPISPTETAV